jgi:hypothetical protein
VDKIHDYVLDKRKNFVLDQTFSNKNRAIENVRRSLHQKRKVAIVYLFQDPLVAWDFTRKREVVEHRNIPKEAFVDAFFAARENVEIIKEEFGSQVQLDIIENNLQNDAPKNTFFNVPKIDKLVKMEYSKNELLQTLHD